MNPFLPVKPDAKIKPSQVFGGFDEIGFEMETPSVSSVAKGVGSIFEDIFSLGADITGVETKPAAEAQKFPPQGTIEFNQKIKEMEEDKKQKEEASSKRIFYQALKEDVARVENARDRMIYEEEIADIGAHISTEEKNEMLHYQSAYKDRSVYQMAELRRKIIEKRMKDEKEKKEVSITQTQVKGKTAMQGMFEGASGSQGSGQANLSFQAAG